MIKTLTTAATGIDAQQANIERISNDLANVNTDGFKRGRTEFEDLMYETIRAPGENTGASSQTPVGVQVGRGVRVAATGKVFEQGAMRPTGHELDIMIQGVGFMPVQLPTGEIGFTRTGTLHKNATGTLVTVAGASIIPQITIPAETMDLKIAPNGEVKAMLPNNGEAILGQIQLVRFQNPVGLNAIGNNLYLATSASGQPIQGVAGENGFGILQQGALEASNTNVANSMVEMISAQRAYEMGTKVMGVADKMMEATINIR